MMLLSVKSQINKSKVKTLVKGVSKMAKTPFVRKLDNAIINQLKGSGNNALFNKLKVDAMKPVRPQEAVFPAIRNNTLDFYHRGSKLFSYQNGEYFTHHKYASVLTNARADYIKESQLKDLRLITDFCEGYERIKENCSLFAGVEANGVSEIYSRYSYLFPESEIVVLDIEIALEAEQDAEKGAKRKTLDRIDLLLFDKSTATLRFYEAKHFTNSELWASIGIKPLVVEQIQKYEQQVKSRKAEIVQTYTEYVRSVNDLFDLRSPNLRLPDPKTIDDKVGLLIFGFDGDQLKGRFADLLLKDHSLSGIYLYSIGNIGGVNINNLWKNTKVST